MTDIKPYLQKMVDRFADPKIQTGLKGFTKTLLFKFTDTQEDYVLRAVDGKQASFSKETLTNPDITVTIPTDTLAGIMDKKVNGVVAYMQRKLQVKGAMEDLMKLQKIML